MTRDPTLTRRLTVIVTTSVTPSAPSTELLRTILASFQQHCPDLLKCNVVVVCDGYDKVSTKARLKKGVVTPQQAEHYQNYKTAVKSLFLTHYRREDEPVDLVETVAEAEYGSTYDGRNSVPCTILQSQDKKVTFIEPSMRLGFALAVRSALRVIQTPYVWVQQHDWVLTTDFPIHPLLEIMSGSEGKPEVPVKYVCLPAIRMLSYAESADVVEFPLLKDLTSSLQGEFTPASQPDSKVPLTPLFFWHDKPHIASVAHYMDRVFPTRLSVLRGDFIEDKIGQRARAQMKEGQWFKWATWLYYPKDGTQLCLRHLKGRTWEGAEGEVSRAEMWRQKNASERSLVPQDNSSSSDAEAKANTQHP